MGFDKVEEGDQFFPRVICINVEAGVDLGETDLCLRVLPHESVWIEHTGALNLDIIELDALGSSE